MVTTRVWGGDFAGCRRDGEGEGKQASSGPCGILHVSILTFLESFVALTRLSAQPWTALLLFCTRTHRRVVLGGNSDSRSAKPDTLSDSYQKYCSTTFGGPEFPLITLVDMTICIFSEAQFVGAVLLSASR